MLKAMRQLLSDVTRTDQADGSVAADDESLAAAALLVHLISIDGHVTEDERQRLRGVLADRFALAPDDAETLINRAYAADREAVDLYRFTSILKSRLDEAGRLRVIEMMWEMAFADGVVHEFEENVMWRVAELLAVPARERVRLRQKVRRKEGD